MTPYNHTVYMREWREKNTFKVKQYRKGWLKTKRIWRKKNLMKARRCGLEYYFRVQFGGLRGTVLQRDDNKCRVCGMTDKEHKRKIGRSITVDHIDGKGNGYPKGQKNNSLNNLQTLCLPCHTRKDRKMIRDKDEQLAKLKEGKHGHD